MKAMVYDRYGSPDVMELNNIEKPVPAANEVLVKVYASSVNYHDWAYVRGKPFLIRLMTGGVLKPAFNILGGDVAGRIEAVGSNVTRFQPGDEVFGDASEHGFGAFADYVAVPESVLALKPANLGFDEAATVPESAVIALQGLRDAGELQPGDRVLICGASGGIGTFAVQIAKALGAEVTGVCSTRNVNMVYSLSADHVIDYTQQDFTQSDQKYDLVLAIAGYRPVAEYARVLAPEGIYVAVGGKTAQVFEAMLLGRALTLTNEKKIRNLLDHPDPKNLEFVRKLIEDGKVSPAVDRKYTLSETAQALQYYGEGHSQGKVVITMEHKGD